MESNRYVEMMKSEGWQVWTRNDLVTRKPAEYCFVTDGKNIAYVQWSGFEPRVSTVHKPNRTTGTGFSMGEPCPITPQTVRDAMTLFAPSGPPLKIGRAFTNTRIGTNTATPTASTKDSS